MKKHTQFRKKNSISGLYRKAIKCRLIVVGGMAALTISISSLPAYAVDFDHLFDLKETKKESDLFHLDLSDWLEKDDNVSPFSLILGKNQEEESNSDTKSSTETKSSADAKSSTETKSDADAKNDTDTSSKSETKKDSDKDSKDDTDQDTTDKSGKNSKIPTEYKISDFDIVYQSPELPTGCEITAATMLLNYYGFDVEKTTMAKKYLPVTSYSTYYKNGVKYGADMYNYFIGDPASASSGVICGPGAILKAINSYFADLEKTSQTDTKSNTKAESKTNVKSDSQEDTKAESKTDAKSDTKEETKAESGTDIKEDMIKAAAKYKPVDISGSTPEDLYERVSNGQPCLVWVTISMQTRPAAQDSWTTEEGKKVDWTTADHCAVLVGYSKDKVYIADPISGMVEYSRKQFEKVYKSRNQMSLVLES